MTVTRLGRLALAADQREPIRVLLEIRFGIQAVPGMADRDRDRPAHAVVPFPFGQVAGAHGRPAEPVPDLALETEARSLPFVPTSGDRLLLRNDLPGLAREVPTAAERVEERRHGMPNAARLARDQEQVLVIAP